MTSHDNEPATGQPAAAAPETGMRAPSPPAGETPPAPGKTQSGRTILLHWCLLAAGLGAIALAVQLFG